MTGVAGYGFGGKVTMVAGSGWYGRKTELNTGGG